MVREKAGAARTQARIDRRLREGRGQGEGADYRPYLTIRDVPSRGRSHRTVDLSGGRSTHFLSDLEYRFAAIACWLLPVRDFREQFPLPLEGTRAIATTSGYRHPCDWHTKAEEPVTTDLVLSLETPQGMRGLACAVKQSQELGDARTLEKLEIERRWWIQCGTPWVLVTEREISVPLAENILNLQPYRSVADRVSLTDQERVALIDELTRLFVDQRPETPLVRAAQACDERLGRPSGTCLTMVYHLLATRHWHVDLSMSFDPSQPLRLLPALMPSQGVFVAALPTVPPSPPPPAALTTPLPEGTGPLPDSKCATPVGSPTVRR